jgi:hypothetical protein
MERLNGEVRDREKPMRELKRRILQFYEDIKYFTIMLDRMKG